MKEENPFKIVILSILIITFFNFAIISFTSLIYSGALYDGANYALMKNGTNYNENEIQNSNDSKSNERFATYMATGIQEYLDARYGNQKDVSVPTTGLYAIWTVSTITAQFGEVFIMSIVEGIIIGFIIALIIIKKEKGVELLKGYIVILILSVILISLSGVLINSLTNYNLANENNILKLLPNLNVIVIFIIMITVCFLFLLLARNVIENMNKQLARKRIFNDDNR